MFICTFIYSKKRRILFSMLCKGFPRTVHQAEVLDSLHPVSLVINLEVPDDLILDRVKRRWVHVPSGRVYNVGFNDPKVPGKDDVTGEPLVQRPDDRPEVVERRLQEYREKSSSVVVYYERRGLVRQFKGDSTDEIWPKIKECLLPLL